AMAALAGLLLAGCQTLQPPPACPAGQDYVRTAQIFFGRRTGDEPRVTEADFRKFVDEELTPRFRDGLTVVDSGALRSDPDKLVGGAAGVVVAGLPKGGASPGRIEAARSASRSRFHRDSQLRYPPPSCVAF